MNRRLRVGPVMGLEVFVDWSWILTFVLAAWTLVSANRRLLPDLGTSALAIASAMTAAGLFASLGAHELARARVARALGLPVRRLTLFVLGGVSDVERAPASPRTEAFGALSAPLFSLVVAVVIAVGTSIASGPMPRAIGDLDRLGAPGVVLLEIAAANVAIAVVNLLPAYPLDGGRLLRAGLWKTMGDVDRATRISAWAGQVVGWTFVVVGLAVALGSGRGPGMALGVWGALVGWFVASAAAQGYEGVIAQRSSRAAR